MVTVFGRKQPGFIMNGLKISMISKVLSIIQPTIKNMLLYLKNVY